MTDADWKKQGDAKRGETYRYRVGVWMEDITANIGGHTFNVRLGHSTYNIIAHITEGDEDHGTYVIKIKDMMESLFRKIIKGEKIPMEVRK